MIRLATLEDAPIVHKVMLQAFEEYRRLEVPSSALNESIHDIMEALRSEKEQALIYEMEGIPVASCRFKFEEAALYFSRLSVIPEARGKGISKDILSWLESYAHQHYKTWVTCRVRMSVPRNMELYKTVGYQLVEEEVITNSNGFAVKTGIMKKKIDRTEPVTVS